MGKEESNVVMGWGDGPEKLKPTGDPLGTKKRPRKKIREIPEYYFLPRRSIPSSIAFYGSFIVAGIGAGILMEAWINKKIKEDGDRVVWKFEG